MYLSDKAHAIASVTPAVENFLAGTGQDTVVMGFPRATRHSAAGLATNSVVLQDILALVLRFLKTCKQVAFLDSASVLTPTQPPIPLKNTFLNLIKAWTIKEGI
jgi:hypothetical protein